MKLQAGLLVLALLLAGGWLAAALDAALLARLGGDPVGPALRRPLGHALQLLRQRSGRTEHPDRLLWALGPALYLALAGAGLALVPLGPAGALAQLPTGIVLWGAVESLTVVAVFMHGWAANSPVAQIGGYRYVATGLSVILVSMFVLIAAALPAQSLSIAAIVESQRTVWNAVRQPLGLPLFLLLGLSLGLRGPMDYADSSDLAGGTAAERSGPALAVWQAARLAMAVAFSAMSAAVFLGGPLGPWLPGVLWMALKTAAVLVLLVAAGRLVARPTAPRMMGLLWKVLLPLSFAHLLAAGVVALW
jgi:NADH-quinone oxidoreductase subunit H